MREKLLAKLKAQYPGLSNTLLGLIADKGLAKVTQEDQIEGFITELEALPIPVKDFADLLQRDGDKRVSDAKLKWEQDNKKPEPTKPDTEPKPDDANALLLKELNEIKQWRQSVESDKSKELAQAKLAKVLSEKKIPASFVKGRSVEKVEDVDTLVAEIETDFTEFKQELTNQGLMTATPPVHGSTVTGKADDKEVESIVDKII